MVETQIKLFAAALDGALAPQSTATRAQVATILMRFVESEMN